MPDAVRVRALEQILKSFGVKEPEAAHIALAESLVFSENPSAEAHFPGGIIIARNYGTLEPRTEARQTDYQILCTPAAELVNTPGTFTVNPQGTVYIRSRCAGDTIRLPGGSKSVKKLFIDRKIPAKDRDAVPIVCDDLGILGIIGIGVNQDRAAQQLPAVRITVTTVKSSESL